MKSWLKWPIYALLAIGIVKIGAVEQLTYFVLSGHIPIINITLSPKLMMTLWVSIGVIGLHVIFGQRPELTIWDELDRRLIGRLLVFYIYRNQLLLVFSQLIIEQHPQPTESKELNYRKKRTPLYPRSLVRA